MGKVIVPIDAPPAIYDHDFPGRVEIHANYGGEISAYDGPCFPFTGDACAKQIGNVCYIYVVRGKFSVPLIRHEIAHCNGWPGDHPR